MNCESCELKELIRTLLTQGHESEIWDAKQQWHENIEDLIKDIICFANTVHDKDCYIIIGVTDDLKIRGIGAEDRRCKQSDILDTLSNLPFAGDNIPKIEVKTVLMPSGYEQGKAVEIDVLIIYNSYLTPYYLKNVNGRYKNVMVQGCIYSRVGDKNTPNKGNAEIGQVEMLWRKRFGLTKSPLEFIFESLSHKCDWHQYYECWYNIYKPEYVLRLNPEDEETYGRNANVFYSYSQDNKSTQFYNLDIIACNTILKNYQVICLDNGRLFIPMPKLGHLNLCSNYICETCYKYFVKGSNRYRVLEFMYNPENPEKCWAYNNILKVILLYKSDGERQNFEAYIESKRSDFLQRIERCDKYDDIDTGKISRTSLYKYELKTGIVLNEMLTEYRENLSKNNKQ